MSSTLPTAELSRSALHQAAQRAATQAAGRADLRADAWGHGLLEVAEAVVAAGVREVLVDTDRQVQQLAERGITATTTGGVDVDPLILYGLPDASGVYRSNPVMRVVGHVLSVKPLRAGEGVSYGYRYRALDDTRVALVTGGYAQGIVRALGGAVSVGLAQALRPIVGRVAMDACVIEIGTAAVMPGDEVTFFGGSGIAAGALAQWVRVTGMTAAELVTVAGMHAHRKWVD